MAEKFSSWTKFYAWKISGKNSRAPKKIFKEFVELEKYGKNFRIQNI